MAEIGLGHYLTVAAILFAIGMAGIFVNRKNVIVLVNQVGNQRKRRACVLDDRGVLIVNGLCMLRLALSTM